MCYRRRHGKSWQKDVTFVNDKLATITVTIPYSWRGLNPRDPECFSRHPECTENRRLGAKLLKHVGGMSLGHSSIRLAGCVETVEVVLSVTGVARLTDWYAPFVHTELPGELAKLREANAEQVLGFAKTYGCLGFAELNDDPYNAIQYDDDGAESSPGDPVPWIRAHASGAHLCLMVTEAIREKLPAPRLRERLDGFADVLVGIRGDVEPVRINWDELPEGCTPELMARHLRREIVNSNLMEVDRYLGTDEDGQDRSYFRGPCISVVYWHIINAIDGGIVKRCEAQGCEGLFIQTDPRQRFCPKRWRQEESTCAARQRQRNHRPRRAVR
jgi:hypothetical protein